MRPESLLNILATEGSEVGSEVVSNDTFRASARSKNGKIVAASDRFVDLFKRVAVKGREEKS